MIGIMSAFLIETCRISGLCVNLVQQQGVASSAGKKGGCMGMGKGSAAYRKTIDQPVQKNHVPGHHQILCQEQNIFHGTVRFEPQIVFGNEVGSIDLAPENLPDLMNLVIIRGKMVFLARIRNLTPRSELCKRGSRLR